MTPWPRRIPAALSGLLLVGLLGACSAGPGARTDDVGNQAGAGVTLVPSASLQALDAAIGSLSAARGALLADASTTTAGAAALDAVDAAAASGSAEDTRVALAAVPPGSGEAAARLTDRVTAYARSLVGVEDASMDPALPAELREALTALVPAGRAEVATAARLAAVTGVGRRWEPYVELAAAADTWLVRRSAGWYRDQQEAAAAYAVLTAAPRPALTTLRRDLAEADAAQAEASATAGAAVTVVAEKLPLVQAPAG